jgi:hypothetical protein
MEEANDRTAPPFYVLRPRGNRRFGTVFAFADVLDPHNVGDNRVKGVCPQCREGLGMLPWLPPHRVKLSSRRYPDLLWGAGFDLMVSARFRALYEAAGMTGILRFDPPAEVVRVGRVPAAAVDPPPPVYHNIIYQHGGADLDDERSGAWRLSVPCDYCRPSIDAVDRVTLRPGSWTGSDIFVAYGLPGHRLATHRLRDLILDNALTNALLIPAEEYSMDRGRR